MEGFGHYQPIYAAYGIPIFPVDPVEKKPLVSNYGKMGLPASRKLVEKFGDELAFGFCLGRHTRITIVDVDTADETVLEKVLRHCGETPVIVESASRGGFHVYYRHNGEKRQIKPGELPIDILGGGFVLAPFSRTPKGQYEFLQGGLEDLRNLPTMRNPTAPKTILLATPAAPRNARPIAVVCTREGEGNGSRKATRGQDDAMVPEGERNEYLFNECMRAAPGKSSQQELIEFARDLNRKMCSPPLPEAETTRIAKSAWGYTEADRNFYEAGHVTPLPNWLIDELKREQEALHLITILRRHHWGRTFLIANGMEKSLGWRLKRLQDARALLIEKGLVVCIQKPKPREPGIYDWGPRLRRRGKPGGGTERRETGGEGGGSRDGGTGEEEGGRGGGEKREEV